MVAQKFLRWDLILYGVLRCWKTLRINITYYREAKTLSWPHNNPWVIQTAEQDPFCFRFCGLFIMIAIGETVSNFFKGVWIMLCIGVEARFGPILCENVMLFGRYGLHFGVIWRSGAHLGAQRDANMPRWFPGRHQGTPLKRATPVLREVWG